MTVAVVQMRALLRTELLLFRREPTALFFSLAFPLILLLFVGSIGATEEVGEGIRYIDSYLASMVAVTAANVGILGLSIHVAENRGRGALKRYRLSPMHPAVFFAAQFGTALVTVAVALATLVLVTAGIYGLSDAVNWLAFLVTTVAILYVCVSWGLLLGGLRVPLRSVQVIAAGVFFLMFFSSGAALPRQSFPEWMQAISQWNPLAICNDIVVAAYSGYGDVSLVRVLALVLCTAAVNAATFLTFDWEGRGV